MTYHVMTAKHSIEPSNYLPCVFHTMTDQDREGLIVLLLQEGSTDHAIELYCEETGASWEDATAAVTELAQRHGVSLRRKRLIPWLVAGIAALLGSALAFQG